MIFKAIFDVIDQSLINVILQGAQSLAQGVSGPLRLGLVLYVVAYGIAVMRGVIQVMLLDAAIRVLKLCLVVSLVTESDVFQNWVVNLLYDDIPNSIQNALLGSTGGQYGGQTFDNLWSFGMKIGQDIIKSSGWTEISNILLAVLLMATTSITCAIGAVVMVYAKIALALVVSLGPLFIALALFDATRRWTEAWLVQAVNYILLMVLIVGLSSLIARMVMEITTRTRSVEAQTVMMLIGVTTIYVFAAIIFTQLPALASGLASGGASLSSGISNAARTAAGYIARSSRTVNRGSRATVTRA